MRFDREWLDEGYVATGVGTVQRVSLDALTKID